MKHCYHRQRGRSKFLPLFPIKAVPNSEIKWCKDKQTFDINVGGHAEERHKKYVGLKRS